MYCASFTQTRHYSGENLSPNRVPKKDRRGKWKAKRGGKAEKAGKIIMTEKR
jgi:hypothetical protein